MVLKCFRIAVLSLMLAVVGNAWCQVTFAWDQVGLSFGRSSGGHLAVDSSNRSYVVSQGAGVAGEIESFDTFGRPMVTANFGSASEFGVAFDSHGNMLIGLNILGTDGHEHANVVGYNPAGQFIGNYQVPQLGFGIGLGVTTSDEVVIVSNTDSTAHTGYSVVLVTVLFNNLTSDIFFTDEAVTATSAYFSRDGHILVTGTESWLKFGGAVARDYLADGTLSWARESTNTVVSGNQSSYAYIASIALNNDVLLVRNGVFSTGSVPDRFFDADLLTSQGAVVWTHGDNGSGNVTTCDVQSTQFCYFTGFDAVGNPFLCSYDHLGDVAWSRSTTGTMAADGATGVVVANTSAPNMTSPANLVVTKYEITGGQIWSATYPGVAHLNTPEIMKIVNGRIFIYGHTNDGSTDQAMLLSYVQGFNLNQFTPTALSVFGGQNFTGALDFTGPNPGAATTTILMRDTAAVTIPSTVSLASGTDHVSFPIATNPVTTIVTGHVTAYRNGVRRVIQVTINPARLFQFVVTPSSATGGSAGVRGVVRLEGTSSSDVVVALHSSDAHATVPATATIPHGATAVSFPIGTTHVTAVTTVTLTGVYHGVTVHATLTLNP